LGKRFRAILRRIKQREWLADDFVGRVALQPLGTGVPTTNGAIYIDHLDGVVHDRVYEQLKPPRVGDAVEL
jgi:hypothetical protein